MGRGTRTADHASSTRSAAPRPTAGSTAQRAPADLTAAFAGLQVENSEPDWRTPGGFYLNEAEQFCDPARATDGGLPIDPIVALKLLRFRFNGDWHRYARWYNGARSNVIAPERTVAGMNAAAQTLSDALNADETIAVYCDYDVDGTSAGEALRQAMLPYLTAGEGSAGSKPSSSRLFYGYADAQRGFGLTNDFVQRAHDAGAKLLITLDCGSGQVAQVRFAQSLGMKVIVVDHHGVDPDNPADHHLNPRLTEPMSSHNTGAQLAWKLGAALQIAREGRTRDEHWDRAMFVAGMGCLADMGSVVDEENRTFLWSAADHVPVGVTAVAAALGEEPVPGGMVRTQAVLNLPKRTSKVSADDIGALFACDTPEQAAPLVSKLMAAYEHAQPVRRQMQAAALSQTGEKQRGADGEPDILPHPEERVAFAVLDDFEDYSGYSGPTASRVSQKAGKPAFVFVRQGVDDLGQTLYRFSSRNDAAKKVMLGELEHDPDMQAACTVKAYDEAGDVIEKAKCGGHANVFSGTCTAENLSAVQAAVRAWADAKPKSVWQREPWTGAEAYLQARKVSPRRLAAIEEQAKRLGPYTFRAQQLYTLPDGTPHMVDRHTAPKISVEGVLSLNGRADADNDAWLVGELDLGDGVTREIRYPADAAERPVGERCEWVLTLGQSGAYWLRLFHRLAG